MADFQTIETRVKRRIIDLPADTVAEIPSLINEAIREAEERYNFQVMRAEASFTTVLATRKLGDVPADWKDEREHPWLREGQDGILGERLIRWAPSKEQLLTRYSIDDTNDDGAPRLLLREENTVDAVTPDEIHVFPLPDGNSQWDDSEYRVVVPYWKYIADLSAPTDTNWFTVNALEYVMAKATSKAFTLNWDEQRAQVWAVEAERQFKLVRKTDKMRKFSQEDSFPTLLGARGSIYSTGRK